MGKQKYTETEFQEAINLRLQGFSKKEISKKLNIGIPTLSKLFAKRNVVISDEIKLNLIKSRWKDYNPIVDGKKKCSRCNRFLETKYFTVQSSSKSGLSDACKLCFSTNYKKNKKIIKERVRKYRNLNKDKIKNAQSEYYEKNKEKIIKKISTWRKQNPEKTREYEKRYDQKNKGFKVERNSRYRASKIGATPKWLTEEQKMEMREFYRNCPPGHHVDHIVPLRSNIVCGLHVPWNLQYLPDKINESKGSTFFDPNSVGSCHQYKVKISTEQEDRELGMPFDCSMEDLVFKKEDLSDEHVQFIKRYEWLGTVGYLIKPDIYVARHYLNYIAGIVIIDQPNAFTKGIDKDVEALIHRGATTSWAPKNLGSKLVMYACRESVKNTKRRIFMAYSDPEAGEIGTIYQASNFRYIGNRFGAKISFVLPSGKTVSGRYFTKTSTFKRYCREIGVEWLPEWEKPNGYQDLKKIPKEILEILREMGKQEMASSEIIHRRPKGKYVKILGKDRKEQKILEKKYGDLFPALPYPKRSGAGVSPLGS